MANATALRDHLRRRVIQKQSEMPPPLLLPPGMPFGVNAYPGFGVPGAAYPPVSYGPPFGYRPFFPY